MDMIKQLSENLNLLSQEADRYLPNAFRISSLVYCPAKEYYYRKLGLRPKINGKMLSGLMLHEKLPMLTKNIEEFKDAKYEVECHRKYPKFSISGHCDILTATDVYEFKYSASNLERYDMPLHWILQVNAYATLLEKENWNLVIINSQSLNIVVLPGKQSSLYYDSIFDSAASIYDSLQDNKAPAGPTYPFECTYCELKTICVNYLAKVNKNGK